MKGLIIYFYFFKGWGVNFGVLVMKLFHSGLTSNFKVRGFDAKLGCGGRGMIFVGLKLAHFQIQAIFVKEVIKVYLFLGLILVFW